MKKSLFTVFLLACSIAAFSQSVSIDVAKTLAKNKYGQYYKSKFKKAPVNIAISHEYVIKNNNDTLYYVFNFNNNKGFVIISADRRAYPIIGYSYSGTYSPYNQPPAFSEWMKEKKQEIIYIKTNNVHSNETIKTAWKNLKTYNKISEESVGPLLQTTWNQNCFYNALCPSDTHGPCGHVWAGCEATAMAQIGRAHV